MRIAKYEFDSREQAQSKIDALGTATDEDGNEYPTHKSTIVHLGNIVLEQGEYDEEGEEVTAPVLSEDPVVIGFFFVPLKIILPFIFNDLLSL